MLSSGLLSASRTRISAISDGRSTKRRFGGNTAKTLFPSALAAPASNQILFLFGTSSDGMRRIRADALSISLRITLDHRSPGFTSESRNTDTPRRDIKLAKSLANSLFSWAYERNTYFVLDIWRVLHSNEKLVKIAVEGVGDNTANPPCSLSICSSVTPYMTPTYRLRRIHAAAISVQTQLRSTDHGVSKEINSLQPLRPA